MANSPLICHINLARGYRGGERQTELLIRELAARGCRQRLLARVGEPLIQALVDVEGLERIGIRKPFLLHASYCADAAVLQVHEAKAGHLACLAHRRYGVPYVLTRRVDKPPRASWVNRYLYRNAAAVVAVSQAIGNVLAQVFPPLQPEVIADAYADLPVDPDCVRALRQRFTGRFVIGHAAALVDRHKGQAVLIEAMRLLEQKHPALQLLLLGRGEDEARLREAANGLSNVHFEGFVSNLGDYLQAMDLFAFPSRYEGLGSVLLDAMHAGLPVVASDVGGIPEIVSDGRNGLLVPPGNAHALAEAIERVYLDAALRETFAAAARERAHEYSPAVMADKYLELYRHLEARQ